MTIYDEEQRKAIHYHMVGRRIKDFRYNPSTDSYTVVLEPDGEFSFRFMGDLKGSDARD